MSVSSVLVGDGTFPELIRDCQYRQIVLRNFGVVSNIGKAAYHRAESKKKLTPIWGIICDEYQPHIY